jgi:hypothetical protein
MRIPRSDLHKQQYERGVLSKERDKWSEFCRSGRKVKGLNGSERMWTEYTVSLSY